MMTNYWISWYHNHAKLGEFELHSPWWVSGSDLDGNVTIVAAVKAEDEDAARVVIHECYDTASFSLDWRFVNERESDWAPFCDRFPKADWMKW
jgi:hypothetical protein